MSITVKLQIEHELNALGPTLRRLETVEIRPITQVTTDPGATVFPFLIEYEDRAALEAALDDDATVDSYELVDWNGQTGIYNIEHTPETKLISTVVTDVNGFLAHTESSGNGWLVQLLLPDREALMAIWEYAKENDITLDIIEIYGTDETGSEISYGLTAEQKAALITAFDSGYFEEPRNTSLEGVAEEMGLSSTAVSGRLRRGIRNLLAATVAEDDDGE
jgi:predicted DNA binding protein